MIEQRHPHRRLRGRARPTVAGFYSNRDEMAERYKKAAKAAGEAMWHMPLVEDLREGLKSDWADIKHIADRWGGSITAALFLASSWRHAVDPRRRRRPSMANKAYNVFAKGGTGQGVLTFLKVIEDHAASSGRDVAAAQEALEGDGPRGHRLRDDRRRRSHHVRGVGWQGQLRAARDAGRPPEAGPRPLRGAGAHIDQGHPGYPGHLLTDYMAAHGHPFRMVAEDTYAIVTDKIPAGKTYCSLCSRLRRGILYRLARELGCTKMRARPPPRRRHRLDWPENDRFGSSGAMTSSRWWPSAILVHRAPAPGG